MSRPRILVIEDNEMNLELAITLLETKGFTVISARTAEEGLRLAQQHLPELILMDFSLPGMDGVTATKSLKANPATRNLAVIGLSANAMKGVEESALNAGCSGYLTKPIDTRSFASIIESFLAPK